MTLLKLAIFGLSTLISPFLRKPPQKASEKTAHDFSFQSITGDALPLSQFRGCAILLVNTASECGFTKQYKELQTLYDAHRDRGLVVLGVPSNDFGGQEPGENAEIKQFCEIRFGVIFPMTSKQIVSGGQAHPLYLWAKDVLGWNSAPKWNFHKYLIDRDGKLVDYFASTVAPDSAKLITAINAVLDKK